MQKTVQTILKEAEAYVMKELSSCSLSEQLLYHSFDHTQDVVLAVREIADEQDVGSHERFLLELAAWFHDIGYVQGCEGHEETSARWAAQFMKDRKLSNADIQVVRNCILATKMPQNPQTRLEQIMCDADLMHLAKEDYFKRSEKLHKEIERIQDKEIPQQDWMEMNSNFLGGHCFFTKYAKDKYGRMVKENLKKVNQRLKRWQTTQ